MRFIFFFFVFRYWPRLKGMGSGLNLGGIVAFNERKQLEHDGHATISEDKLAVVVKVRVHLESVACYWDQGSLEGQLACPCVKTRNQVA